LSYGSGRQAILELMKHPRRPAVFSARATAFRLLNEKPYRYAIVKPSDHKIVDLVAPAK
jgi:hypothetical protein